MLGAVLRRNMSQKLSVLLLIFGLAWGLMLLRYTAQQPRQSSAELREQILELSRRYVKVLTEENQNAPGGPQGTHMAGYDGHTIESGLLECSSCNQKIPEVFLMAVADILAPGVADLKRTIAVLLDDILTRLVKLEGKIDLVVNASSTNTSHAAGGVLSSAPASPHKALKQDKLGSHPGTLRLRPHISKRSRALQSAYR